MASDRSANSTRSARCLPPAAPTVSNGTPADKAQVHSASLACDWSQASISASTGDGSSAGQFSALTNSSTRRTLHPGLALRLHRDEGEGYYLNLSSGAPVWFVMWRIADEDPSQAWPELVTLSYNEAGRLLDAQERVDNLPLPADLQAWLQAYTDAHYRPEPKRRQRPASFRAPDQR